MKKIFIFLLLFFSGFLGFIFSLYLHKEPSRNDVQLIQTFHYPASFVKQLANDPDAGKKIFKEFCAACHAKQANIDVHAPLIGDKTAWEARRKLGVSTLLRITIEGAGAMPARGGCFECSDEQLRETIRYMMDQS